MEQQCWVFEIAKNKSNIPVVVWVSIKGKRTPNGGDVFKKVNLGNLRRMLGIRT
jgi:hypothetical protein